MFDVVNVALQFVTSLRPIIEAIAEHDPDLARQLRKSSSSTALNAAEGSRRIGRDAKNRYTIAAGECFEAATAVRIGVASGCVDDAAAAAPLALADRVLAMLWRLRHPRR